MGIFEGVTEPAAEGALEMDVIFSESNIGFLSAFTSEVKNKMSKKTDKKALNKTGG